MHNQSPFPPHCLTRPSTSYLQHCLRLQAPREDPADSLATHLGRCCRLQLTPVSVVAVDVQHPRHSQMYGL